MSVFIVGLRGRVAQIQQQMKSNGSSDFNVGQYQRTVNNMPQINGLYFHECAICHVCHLCIQILSQNSRHSGHGVTVIYVNSSYISILSSQLKYQSRLTDNITVLLQTLQPLVISDAVRRLEIIQYCNTVFPTNILSTLNKANEC